jgi:hypothetical protein
MDGWGGGGGVAELIFSSILFKVFTVTLIKKRKFRRD